MIYGTACKLQVSKINPASKKFKSFTCIFTFKKYFLNFSAFDEISSAKNQQRNTKSGYIL